MTWHVEGHAAAIMRRDKMKNATLYLNARPCRKPEGCHAILPDALPVGYTLTVVYRIRGAVRTRIYKGNGKGLDEHDE